ncbi:hypothetical protein LTR04_007304, partial [Oleoguttula sp. CCFEE 6159]
VCSRSLSMRIYTLSGTKDNTRAEILRTLKPHAAPVVTSSIDRTGTLLATGGADGVTKVWDIRGGFATHTFHGHGGLITALHFFEVSTSEPETTPRHRKGKSKNKQDGAIGLSTAEGEATLGFRLATGHEDGKIRIWDLHKRKSIVVLDLHVSVVRSLEYSEHKDALLSGSRDKTVMLWDGRTWKNRSTIPILESVESAGFLKDGQLIYTGGENGRLRLWQTKNGMEVTQEQQAGAETESIVEVLYLKSSPFLFSVHADQTFALHSLTPIDSAYVEDRTIEPLPITRRISGTHDEVIDLAYVGSDRNLMAIATNLEDIRIISVATSSSNPASSSDEHLSSPIGGNYFGADVALLRGHEDIIICLDIDWSGHWLATGAKDNTARLWRIDPASNSYQCYATFTGHAESLGAIALPRTAPLAGSLAHSKPLENPPAFLITGSQDKTIKRWDIPRSERGSVTQPRATYTRKAHDKDINAIDLSPTSAMFASASQDRTVKIWSVDEGESVGVLRGHKRGVWSVRFAPKEIPPSNSDSGTAGSTNKGLVATGSGDKTVKIWSLSDYSCLRTFEGHTNSVLKVLWLPHVKESEGGRSKRGPQLASAAGDGLVKIWDVQTGEVATTLDNHEDRVWALVIKPPPASSLAPAANEEKEVEKEATTLVSGGGDSIITFWTDTTALTTTTRVEAQTARVEQDQSLQNYIRNGSYREAITLALQLNHPKRLLDLFKAVVNKQPPEEGSLSGVKGVDDVLAGLGNEQLWILLCRLRDWNTNARNSHVAQKIFWTLMRLCPKERFVKLRRSAKREADSGEEGAVVKKGAMIDGGSLKEVLDALKAYTERHYSRMQKLGDEAYLVTYTLQQMDEVNGIDLGGLSTTDGKGGAHEEDVVMLDG